MMYHTKLVALVTMLYFSYRTMWRWCVFSQLNVKMITDLYLEKYMIGRELIPRLKQWRMCF